MPLIRESAKGSPFWGALQVMGATFTVGAEAANVITVTVQLTGPEGLPIAQRVAVRAYLSGVATGADIVGTAPTGGVAIGANGKILASMVTNKMLEVVTDAAGLVALALTDTGTPTFYLVVVLPDGTLAISGAITFA
jgi:hypothetical protein